jgi:predicted RNA binding protein YcfA (HicA-like mRNA interferase family)
LSPKRLPRDLDADALIRALTRSLDYEIIRQTGSHIRLRTLRDGEHHETIPHHSPLKLGTLNAILKNLAAHHRMDRDQLLELLDL